MKAAFTLNRPQNVWQSLTQRLKKQTRESKLQREAKGLSEQDARSIENALNHDTFDEKVADFSQTIDRLAKKSSEDLKPLSAAIQLGMDALSKESENPIIDMTAEATDRSHYPGPVLRSAQAGLAAYQTDPNGNLFAVAGDLEDAGNYLTPVLEPYLLKENPEAADHLELYEEVSSFQDFPTGQVFRALAEDPNRPLAATMKDVLQFPYHYGHAYATETDELAYAVDRIYSEDPDIQKLVGKVQDSLRKDYSIEGTMKFLDEEIAKAQ